MDYNNDSCCSLFSPDWNLCRTEHSHAVVNSSVLQLHEITRGMDQVITILRQEVKLHSYELFMHVYRFKLHLSDDNHDSYLNFCFAQVEKIIPCH